MEYGFEHVTPEILRNFKDFHGGLEPQPWPRDGGRR